MNGPSSNDKVKVEFVRRNGKKPEKIKILIMEATKTSSKG